MLPVDEQAELQEHDVASEDELLDEMDGDDVDEDIKSSRFVHEQPIHAVPLYSLLSSDKQAKVGWDQDKNLEKRRKTWEIPDFHPFFEPID